MAYKAAESRSLVLAKAAQTTAKAEALLADLRDAAGEACSLLGSGSSARDREAEARLKAAISTLAERLAAEL